MRLIDADSLKERMFNYYDCVNRETCKRNYNGDTLMDYEVADMIDDCIDGMPTVDAEPVRHGKWIKIGIDNDDKILFECSECKGLVSYYSNPKGYCRHCGAKMDLEDE